MDPISRIKLRWLHGALRDVTSELGPLPVLRVCAERLGTGD
jgi:hypothetical protein